MFLTVMGPRRPCRRNVFRPRDAEVTTHCGGCFSDHAADGPRTRWRAKSTDAWANNAPLLLTLPSYPADSHIARPRPGGE